jgi:hypothetical protein
MKAFLFLSLISQNILAAELKCGHYKLAGMITNGKARVLAVKEKDGNVLSFFLHESCPEIKDGPINGDFYIHSVNPTSIKCIQKKYKNSKLEVNRLKVIKKIKCS